MAASSIGRSQVVVPEEYSSAIIQGTIRESAVLQLCGRLPMGTLIEHMPVMSALPSAGFVNPRDSGKKITTSVAWQGVILTAEEIACIVPVPQALLDDANFDIFGQVQPRISEAMGAVIDAAALFGTNAPASWPAGGVFASAFNANNRIISGSQTPNDIAEEVNQLMALVENDGFDVSGFVALNNIKSRLRGLRSAGSGVLLFQPSLQVGTPDSLYGEPIHYSRNASFDTTKAQLFGGDWSMAVVGLRQDIRAQVLTEATFTNNDGTVAISLAEQDMVALRVYMRLGFAVANPATISNPVQNRTVTDGVTNSDTSLVSATAAFTANDVEVNVTGPGIPAGTTIESVTNATTVVLSQATTATATGVSVTITATRSPFAVLEPVGGYLGE